MVGLDNEQVFHSCDCLGDICKSGEARKNSWLCLTALNTDKHLASCLGSNMMFAISSKQDGMDLEANQSACEPTTDHTGTPPLNRKSAVSNVLPL